MWFTYRFVWKWMDSWVRGLEANLPTGNNLNNKLSPRKCQAWISWALPYPLRLYSLFPNSSPLSRCAANILSAVNELLSGHAHTDTDTNTHTCNSLMWLNSHLSSNTRRWSGQAQILSFRQSSRGLVLVWLMTQTIRTTPSVSCSVVFHLSLSLTFCVLARLSLSFSFFHPSPRVSEQHYCPVIFHMLSDTYYIEVNSSP